MNWLFIKLGFCLICSLSPGCLADDDKLAMSLVHALVGDPRNIENLQGVFYPATSTPASSVDIFIGNCAFVVKKIQEPSSSDPAFVNCSFMSNECTANPMYYCFNRSKSGESNVIHLTNIWSNVLHFVHSWEIKRVLLTVDPSSFKFFDWLLHVETQPFNSHGRNYPLIYLSIDELQLMPSRDIMWEDLQLLASWVSNYSTLILLATLKLKQIYLHKIIPYHNIDAGC